MDGLRTSASQVLDAPLPVTGSAGERRHSPRKVAAASFIGSTIEWYDFLVYSQAAALVFGKLFFPQSTALAGTLASLATFGAGFLARPIGGIVFGHLGDRIGRKAALVMTLLMMGGATMAVGLLPTFSQSGIWAPIALVALRLIQGFAVGGEWGGAVLMSVEHAPAGRRAFYGSFPQMGIPLALILATSTLALVSTVLTEDEFLGWGWRIPFLLSGLLVVVGLVIRLSIEETPVFRRLQREGQQVRLPVMELVRGSKKQIALTIGSQTGVNIGFHVVTVFALAYATTYAGVSRNATLIALVIASVVDLVAMPVFALLADVVGRKPVLVGGTVFFGLFMYPFFLLISSGHPVLLRVGLAAALALGHAPVYAVTATFFAESFGARTRYSGISLGYQLAGAISSGPTPFLAAALVAVYGGFVPIVIMMLAGSVIAALCFMSLPETLRSDI
jgi:metabolite-proton symporter